ncbi:protein RoBo-1-like, partial [Perognathus longimembris pacificus]|uniref:protein RoBo-1-like n=1 Tax=Perognathus longimembris pacificus TaxID=214514 RepID=UPI0020198E9A
GDDACSSDLKTCDESANGCFSTKQEFNISGNHFQQLKQKGCSSSDCVPLAFTATLGNQRTFGYTQQCCQGEKCNQKDFPLFQKSSDTNGIECPACYTENDNSCVPTPLKCTGAETKCVMVTGEEYQGGGFSLMFVARGCATETACNLKDLTVLGGVKVHTSCPGITNASSPLMSTISSVLASIFLLKILL